MKKILVLSALTIASCTQYWVKDGVNLQQTSKDLYDCRHASNQGGQKVFNKMEMEGPCMTSKGYNLSHTPPKE